MSENSPEGSRSISHQEWLRLLDIRFRQGRNPWRDIYNAETTRAIGAIIRIRADDSAALFRLRSSLASAAESMSTFPAIFGDINPRTAKQEWTRQAKRKATSLLDHFQKEGRFEPEHPGLPEYRAQISKLETGLQEFISTLDGLNETGLESGPATLHADFLQFVVNRLTEVFAQFRPEHEIKRASADGVYGAYPDFIRAAAKPYLMVHYPKYRLNPKRYEKLDRQIQTAVARASPSREQKRGPN